MRQSSTLIRGQAPCQLPRRRVSVQGSTACARRLTAGHGSIGAGTLGSCCVSMPSFPLLSPVLRALLARLSPATSFLPWACCVREHTGDIADRRKSAFTIAGAARNAWGSQSPMASLPGPPEADRVCERFIPGPNCPAGSDPDSSALQGEGAESSTKRLADTIQKIRCCPSGRPPAFADQARPSRTRTVGVIVRNLPLHTKHAFGFRAAASRRVGALPATPRRDVR